MTLEEQIRQIGRDARAAARSLAIASGDQRNLALNAMADELTRRAPEILEANSADVRDAEAAALGKASIDRLRLSSARIGALAEDVRQIARLPDPVGRTIAEWTRPNGIRIARVSAPLGVIGIIYESRPNVTSDAAVLCVKAGSAVILRGGSEAIRSNAAIAAALQAGAVAAGLSAHAIQLIPTRDRAAVRLMAELDESIDLIIPRGGHELIAAVAQHARMPVIKHFHGICHVFVDRQADLDMAVRIAVNAKCQRPGVCNAMETLLVHRDIAGEFLRRAAPAFMAHAVEIRADRAGHAELAALGYQPLREATEADWSTEYLDTILSLRIVGDVAEAIDHVERYGSHHSDAIVTRDRETAERFLNEVDSATVYWNASTRFTDGGEFGFGAEIGISTDKIHARGPMGLEELTTYKYLIRGDGQVRE